MLPHSPFPRPLLTAGALLALIASSTPVSALQDSGAPLTRTTLGTRTVIDSTTVSTSTAPSVAAQQSYRQFPFVISLPSGTGSPGAERTLVMSYNVNTDSGLYAERIRTKRSTDGGRTWTDLNQAVPMTNTVRTKTGLVYSMNFRTSLSGAAPTPVLPVPGLSSLEKPGVGTHQDAPERSGVEAPQLAAAAVSKTFTTRYWTSTTNGAAWTTATGTATMPWALENLYFHRSIVIAPSGEWISTAYGHLPGDPKYTSFIMSSTDQGKTWKGVATAGTRLLSWGQGVTEPTIEFNSRGQLVMVYRMNGYVSPAVCAGSTTGNPPVAMTVSNDLGRTWSAARQISVPGQTVASSDPQLFRAPTGQLLLSVGRPFNQALVSEDGTGDSWTFNTRTAAIVSSGYTSLVTTGRGYQMRQFGDLGSNWCFDSASGATRTAAIFTVPYYMRPLDGQVLDLRTGLGSGRMKVTASTFSGTLSANTTPLGLGDGNVEPDTGLVSANGQGSFVLDLGNWYMIRGVGLAMPTQGASASAELSADGATWTRVASWGASDKYRALTDRGFAPVRTRYVRVSSAAQAQALVSEMRLYTTMETFEHDVPDALPASVTAAGTNSQAWVTTRAERGFESSNAVQIQDESTASFPRITAARPASSSRNVSFAVNPTRITTAMTVTISSRLSSGAVVRGVHAGLFPDGSVKRYDGSRWIDVAPAGTVPTGQWSTFSVYANASGSEFFVNGKRYSGLPLTARGGVYTDAVVSAGGTKTTGDDFLIDNLVQR